MRNTIKLAALALGFLFGMGAMQARAEETTYGALAICGDGAHDMVSGQNQPVTSDQEEAMRKNAAKESLTPFRCMFRAAEGDEFIAGLTCKKGIDTPLSFLGKSDKYSFIAKAWTYLDAIVFLYTRALRDGFSAEQCKVITIFQANGNNL